MIALRRLCRRREQGKAKRWLTLREASAKGEEDGRQLPRLVNLQKLFASPVRYEIPLFQRPYIWNQERQWDSLWEDVQNTAEHYLEKPGSQSITHFLGAVVLQQQHVPTPMLMTRLVVDGQQRLTTLQLLLDAVQEVFERRGIDTAAKRLELLVLNHEAFRGDNDDHAYKVWPTMADQAAFRNTMHNDLSSEESKESLIVRAHEFFKLQIRQWLDKNSEENESRAAEALEQTVSNLLELVVNLDQSDSCHLRDAARRHCSVDLIKNMVLFEAAQAPQVTPKR